MEFTKDTSKILTAIYKTYLERLNNGYSKSDAKYFELDFYKNIPALSSCSEDDVIYSIEELSDTGFVDEYISGDFQVQNSLIAHMENRFQKEIAIVTKYLADLIAGIVPGLKF